MGQAPTLIYDLVILIYPSESRIRGYKNRFAAAKR